MDNNVLNQLKRDLFLKQIQLLSQTNNITHKQIYAQLISQEIPERERLIDISKIFNSLQENNKSNPKIDVFADPNWNYFCQFVSKNVIEKFNKNPIKIYVPLKKRNIEKNIKKIFDFITTNNIEHCSKLAKNIRTDNLVIRVYDKEDADKIINFINNDLELNDDMYNPNPFTINEGKIGLAMDRILSYNTILSKYIEEYIKYENEKNVLASEDGFRFFLEIKLDEILRIEDLSQQIKMCEERDKKNIPHYLKSLEEITTLLVKVLKKETKEDIYQYFKDVNDANYNRGKGRIYAHFSYEKLYKHNHELLKELITVTNEKYGYIQTKKTLEAYKNNGELNYITRTNDLREKVESSESFRTYLSLIDIEKEMMAIIPKKNSEVETSKESIMEDVFKSTYISCQTPERGFCGKNQVVRALIRIKSNDYNCITRINNARALAQEKIKPEEVERIIMNTLESNGYIIENEIDLYELYATHIEHLCERGKKYVKK